MLYVFCLCIQFVFSLYMLFSFNLCEFFRNGTVFLAAFSLAKHRAVPSWHSPGFSNRLPWRYGGGVQRSHVSLGIAQGNLRIGVTLLPVAREGWSCLAMPVQRQGAHLVARLQKAGTPDATPVWRWSRKKCQSCGFRIQIETMHEKCHGRPCRWRIPRSEAKVLVDQQWPRIRNGQLFCGQRIFMDG